MQNRLVLVLCNIKPAQLLGETSSAVVLAAFNDEHTKVEVFDFFPSSSSSIQPGERIGIAGSRFVVPTNQITIQIYDSIAKELRTDSKGNAAYKGQQLITASGAKMSVATLNGCLFA